MLGRQLFSWNAADTVGKEERRKKEKKPEGESRRAFAA